MIGFTDGNREVFMNPPQCVYTLQSTLARYTDFGNADLDTNTLLVKGVDNVSLIK